MAFTNSALFASSLTLHRSKISDSEFALPPHLSPYEPSKLLPFPTICSQHADTFSRKMNTVRASTNGLNAVGSTSLVVAFVLEAFFAEMDLETSEKCEGDEKEVEGAKDRRRSLGSKTRSQRIDVLLHHMLSAELTETQPSNA